MRAHQYFEAVRAKLARANHHIKDLENACNLFAELDPYSIKLEQDPQTGHYVYRIIRLESVPEIIPLILGDAIHNIRTSLDHLICSFVLASDLVGVERQKAFLESRFPFAKSESQFLSQKILTRKFISSDLKAFLIGLRPFEGGNTRLYALHQFDIIDKHRMLLVSTAGAAGVTVGLPNVIGDNRYTAMGPQTHVSVLTEGGILFEPVDSIDKLIENPVVKIRVAINEATISGTPDVVWLARDLKKAVEKVVADCEPILTSFIENRS